jgi:hypothetical protein
MGAIWGHVHALGAPEHDLCPPPLDYRARTPPHDAQQAIPLVVGDVSDSYAFGHTPLCATRCSKWWTRHRTLPATAPVAWSPRLAAEVVHLNLPLSSDI